MFVTQLKLIIFTIILAQYVSWGVECPSEEYIDCRNNKCVNSTWACDGDNDCGNWEDEKGCENIPDSPEICGAKELKCENGTGCIDFSWKCDGEKDCLDGSDERQCNETNCLGFKCGNNCLPKEFICDGDKDCFDGSDEKSCFDANSCDNMNCSQSCDSKGKEPRCYCHDGYEVDKNDEKNCIDVNECQSDGICSHQCLNTIGSFKCICKFGFEPVKRGCEAKGADPLLIFSTKHETRGFYLRSNNSLLIRPVETRLAGIDLDPNDERIYGFEASGNRTIFSVRLDGTDYKTIRIASLQTPRSLAVDYVAQNIYIADERLSHISACNLDATWCMVLHDEKSYKPHSIVLDIAEGYMFWSGIGEKTGIYQSGMDGSSPLLLVSDDIVMPTGLALDHTAKRIYWTDAKLNTIDSSDFSGRSREVLSRTRLQYPFSLALFEDYLFWTHAVASSLESCNKFACQKKTVIPHKPELHIRGVRIYHPVLKQNISNPCLLSNCSQICLRTPGNSFRCVCSTVYKLSSDQKTCLKAVSCHADEILCSLTDRCMSRDLICDGKADCPDERDEKNCSKSRREATSPHEVGGNEMIFVSEGSSILVLEKINGNESLDVWNFTISSALISGLAYDSTMKRLFVADLKMPAIYAYDLKSVQGEELVSNRLMSPEDIAFDWMSNNLYWVDSGKGTVEVVSVANRKRAIVLEGLEKPVSLALSSFSGNMFISTIGEEGCVAMYGMDGKNKRILNSIQGLPMSLALHPLKSILYWTDPRAGMILYLNYTSSRSPWILKSGMNGLMSVAVADDNLYWSISDDSVQSEISERVFVQRLSEPKYATPWRRIAHSARKSFTGKSECLINNGGCSYLCLTSQNGRSCACSSAMTLGENGRNCYGKECKESDFKCNGGQCIPDEMKCDGNIDCNDGSDELNCNEQISEAVKFDKTLVHGLLKSKIDLASLPLLLNSTESKEQS